MKMRYSIQIFVASLVLSLMHGGIALPNSHAGILDLFVGIDPPLKKRINVSKMGIAVGDKFHVKKYCSYVFELRIIHKNKIWNEYGDILKGAQVNNGVPIKVHLVVSSVNKETEPIIVFDENVFTKSSGTSLEFTFRDIASMVLDKGDYQVSLELLNDTPALDNVQADFVIGVRPKTSCPSRP